LSSIELDKGQGPKRDYVSESYTTIRALKGWRTILIWVAAEVLLVQWFIMSWTVCGCVTVKY